MDHQAALKLDTPLAKELAEMLLVGQDLQFSIHAMEVWSKEFSDSEKFKSREEEVIRFSLFRDSVVQFVGCFDKSAPFYLKWDEIYQEGDGGHTFFKWMKDVRDAYAAHRFGALRQAAVGATYDAQTDARGIGHFTFVYSGPKPEFAKQLLPFTMRAAKHIEARIRTGLLQIGKQVDAMSAKELLALEKIQFHGISAEEIRMTRAAVQKSRDGKSLPKGSVD